MIDNFTLTVIIRETEEDNDNTELKIFVSPPLSTTYKEISEIWDEQHDTFLKKEHAHLYRIGKLHKVNILF